MHLNKQFSLSLEISFKTKVGNKLKTPQQIFVAELEPEVIKPFPNEMKKFLKQK